ncbi:16S rRNA (cytosine(1402)-N(4))-methyltransferase RsmH [uncultured Salinisphaera sp.]|uniref:16S rRNA (cytosine(1402)-N(4))-methyltransferase RsmH n=1 Tax=uncultured Salinisphaera sp. TaxID=359372 RepID=UPI0032B1CA83|tara:strand:+ start:893 stop:1879 length:987 start_codon:yes stop_codon:yes gene_type:complete
MTAAHSYISESDVMAEPSHVPVMLTPCLDALAINPAGRYIDATFGRGGHARAVLDRLDDDGRLIAFDQDPDAQAVADGGFDDARLTFVARSFADIGDEIADLGLAGQIDGILFDLGVSSPQFDVAERGFSFRHAGPLDMRMDTRRGETLGAWLSRASHGEIARVIKTLGEEPMAGRIAARIIDARANGQLTDTAALARIVADAVPAKISQTKRIHPATRTFQAFRMFINDELGALDAGLAGALTALAPGGRLAVISFHSLEDRRVKRFMRGQARPAQPSLPMAPEIEPALRLIDKPRRADAMETAANPRARSAILRVAERTDAPEVTT